MWVWGFATCWKDGKGLDIESRHWTGQRAKNGMMVPLIMENIFFVCVSSFYCHRVTLKIHVAISIGSTYILWYKKQLPTKKWNIILYQHFILSVAYISTNSTKMSYIQNVYMCRYVLVSVALFGCYDIPIYSDTISSFSMFFFTCGVSWFLVLLSRI